MRRVILLVLAAAVVVCGCRSTPETNDRAEVNRLLKLLDSPDEGTRMRAAAVLVSLEGEPARKAITRRLHRRTEPEVRAALALALEVRPREEFLTQLITMLSDPDDAVAPAAAKALAAYDYDLIAKPLLGIATDRVAPERARRFAIEILGRTGRADVVPTLIELFGEEKLHDVVVAGLKHVTRQDLDELQKWRYWWDANKDRTQIQFSAFCSESNCKLE